MLSGVNAAEKKCMQFAIRMCKAKTWYYATCDNIARDYKHGYCRMQLQLVTAPSLLPLSRLGLVLGLAADHGVYKFWQGAAVLGKHWGF